MREITKPEKLVEVARSQGFEITTCEADTVLGYFEGHDYMLMADDENKTYRRDLQDGEEFVEDKLEEYSFKEAVQFAIDMNGELQEDMEDDQQWKSILAQHEEILAGLYSIISPERRKKRFVVYITERLRKEVVVMADSAEEAEQVVSDRWKSGVYVLGADDFIDVDFKAAMVLPIGDSMNNKEGEQ